MVFIKASQAGSYPDGFSRSVKLFNLRGRLRFARLRRLPTPLARSDPPSIPRTSGGKEPRPRRALIRVTRRAPRQVLCRRAAGAREVDSKSCCRFLATPGGVAPARAALLRLLLESCT